MGRWSDLLDRIAANAPTDGAPPFISTLGLPPISRWEPGRVWLEWQVQPSVFQSSQAVFGGFIAALADHALGFPAMSLLADDEVLTTSNLHVSFLRPVLGGRLRIESRVVHRGKRMMHVEATFTRDDGKLAAVATATQVIIPAAD
jgi:uncharacterized protein (TIGR00369 family)